ncbi:sugar kinase [Lachnospiraceae bacterium 54-53]
MITLGETMVSLCPDGAGPLSYGKNFSMHIAGAESNTAIGLQKLGHATTFVSRLGKDEFGRFIRRMILAEGGRVECREDDRHSTGIMFKENLNAEETRVHYYRRGSAASFLEPGDVKEEWIRKAGLLHLTGITPVLSESCLETVRHAVSAALKNRVKISFDPNIRQKLWGEKDHRELISSILYQAQIVMLGADEGKQLFGLASCEELEDHIFSRGACEYLAVKDGEKGAYVADGKNRCFIPPYECRSIDPIGAGDAFNAGFLAGILEGKSLEECGAMGGICGAYATQTIGDIEGYMEREALELRLQDKQGILR